MSPRPVADIRERAIALDPGRSFIVQAPAGSGKTELLIQRVLRLLATVERPEEVLAITFTKKAAAEMRRRVLEALAAVRDGTDDAGSGHERLTRELAQAVLERDAAAGWRLLDNPARLRVQTIDALCISLVHQMPVLSRLGSTPAIVEDARVHYREAAERTLERLEGGGVLGAALRRFLMRLDGDRAAARTLLEAMLARRDQWLPRVVGFEPGTATREALESAFRDERQRILSRARALLPAAHEEAIGHLARHAAARHPEGERCAAAILAVLGRYPRASEDEAAAWLALADFVLVKEGATVRSTATKREGFPSESAADKPMRDRMRSFLADCAASAGLDAALQAVRRMPPAAFSEDQWEALGAMVAILPSAAAELQLVFAAHGEIDFPGLAQAAVAALGEEDAPTDLLLATDLRVRHLLVDEFQDTSLSQWELLKRLTAGWTPDDGRTAFLVGDPMQSIYRFREADVGLYLRARERGLPQVPLHAVRLTTNFRSQAGLVDWSNATFAAVLPVTEDADAGAVPHAPSTAFHPARAGAAVHWHPFVGRDPEAARRAEARKVVEIARDTLASNRGGTVAILARTRPQLDGILAELKSARIAFRAVEVEPLAGQPLIQDLLAVTRALSHAGDRIAWLALLRAPWCALTVAELHALAGVDAGEEARSTVWALMGDEERLARLGPEGAERVRRVRSILEPFVAQRLRGSLRAHVEGAWTALGGPACAESPAALEDAEAFFDRLDALERAAALPDCAQLETQLAELYAVSAAATLARLSVMTIHNAKGLEFDTVIVPGLERVGRSDERPALRWRARADGTLMMAPLGAAGETSDPAYDYLLAQDTAIARHELERLLYVAATRAIDALHLLGFARTQEKKGAISLVAPPRGSLLHCAWPVAEGHFEQALAAGATAGEPGPAPLEPSGIRTLEPSLLGLRVAEPAVAASPAPASVETAIEFSWVGETARQAGTIAHRWLQRIAEEGVEAWSGERVQRLGERVLLELRARGIPGAEREGARDRVLSVLESAIEDPRGRWILAARPGARSEYRVRVARPGGAVALVVIDRTFVEDGTRWIVDFKTGGHEGGGLERFLDREAERYRAQLTGYASAFPGERVALGLYFPLARAWREVEAAG